MTVPEVLMSGLGYANAESPSSDLIISSFSQMIYRKLKSLRFPMSTRSFKYPAVATIEVECGLLPWGDAKSDSAASGREPLRSAQEEQLREEPPQGAAVLM
ncbi:hypothetical protein [Nostoc sp. JL33]|uniref:hypothetical protein n=1 Tax=Nostoc sp. JL33 TaxID=2815396 RepID=UPI0025EB41EB|nr:hypothetical protein [Nostoc sp. JL33]MBN3870247.1 hypothetical protein [Nostoc sp. JL33]